MAIKSTRSKDPTGCNDTCLTRSSPSCLRYSDPTVLVRSRRAPGLSAGDDSRIRLWLRPSCVNRLPGGLLAVVVTGGPVVRLVVPEDGHDRINIAEDQLAILFVTQCLISFVLLAARASLA